MPRPRKDKPVPLSELKFSGDAAFVLDKLKAELTERDRYINRLENENVGLDRCAAKVWSALEEAESMASRFSQYVEDAKTNPAAYRARMMEMSRYQRLFHEAKDDFQKLRP